MNIIKLNSIILLIALSMKVNISWAESADLLFLESQNLFHESRSDATKLELALMKINQAISVDPKDVNYLCLLGSIYLLSGEFDKAIKSYQEAHELDPQNPNLFSLIGDVKAFQNNHDEALALYNKTLQLDVKNWRAYQNRGYLFFLKNKRARAIEDFNQAIKFNSKALSAYNNRGVLQYEMQNYDSALADFGEVEKLDPNSPIPSFYRGQYLEMKGDIAAAAEKYKIAINIAKNIPLYPNYPEVEIALDRVTAMLED